MGLQQEEEEQRREREVNGYEPRPPIADQWQTGGPFVFSAAVTSRSVTTSDDPHYNRTASLLVGWEDARVAGPTNDVGPGGNGDPESRESRCPVLKRGVGWEGVIERWCRCRGKSGVLGDGWR